MRLLEYQAKQLLKACNVPTPNGTVLVIDDEVKLAAPVVLKSQAPIGGRGKLGGIQIVKDQADIQAKLNQLWKLPIRGFKPSFILAEEALDIQREIYLSLTINRETSQVELLANATGGVEIEDQDESAFFRRSITEQTLEVLSDELADYLDAAQYAFLLEEFVRNTYRCFIDNDCILLEVNPLVITASGQLIAGDAKMVIDDAAMFRHSEWDFFAEIPDHNFVTLDQAGTVATVANGAGLAMATVDAVSARGLKAANFLDIGGSATPDKILTCFRKISELPHVSAIIVNIFGGIVRCDDVARAIITARQQLPNLPPLYIRLTGNREAEAKAILSDQSLQLYEALDDILKALS